VAPTVQRDDGGVISVGQVSEQFGGGDVGLVADGQKS
jgi:hypothetical protein